MPRLHQVRPGETDAPEGLRRALANANAMQDFAMEEIRPGRTGNEILLAVRKRMIARGIDGTMYSHPIGMNGHGAGPLIGLWDYQDGVPGRGDAKVIPSMWYSIELQATTPVPEWNNQPVRMAQEEDMIIDAAGKVRWAHWPENDTTDPEVKAHINALYAKAGITDRKL